MNLNKLEITKYTVGKNIISALYMLMYAYSKMQITPKIEITR